MNITTIVATAASTYIFHPVATATAVAVAVAVATTGFFVPLRPLAGALTLPRDSSRRRQEGPGHTRLRS